MTTQTTDVVAEAAEKLAQWHQLVPVYDYTPQAAQGVIAKDAGRLVEGLLDRVRRLAYWAGKATPAACTCAVEGPDGIECVRCELAALGVTT